jgi:hypothetical protein
MNILLAVILFILLLGALPTWPYSTGWGYYPSGGVGILLIVLLVLLFSRSMDILSTWLATPNLVLEGNPIAKLLGWRWGLPVNAGICLLLAFWPLPAIVLSTTSVLVAARNFQSAWLMRSMGEEAYRDWHVARIQETRVTLFLLSLAGNTLLTACVGGVVILFSRMELVPFAIGAGIVAYAGAVAFYTLLSLWRLRRAALRHEREAEARAARQRALALESAPLAPMGVPETAAGK